MAKVRNWQLGREMEYRFPEAHPDRQLAFVFNTNRCIACQTCTMSCKSTWTFSEGQEYMWWNNVETKPYGGYPHNWDVRVLELLEAANPGGQVWDGAARGGPYGVFRGMTVFEAAAKQGGKDVALGYAPTDAEWSAPNIGEDTAVGPPGRPGTYDERGARLPEHTPWFFYLQRVCNHCSYPACLAACPRNAIYKRKEDGIVLIDQARCRGYRKCVEACPYKKSMFRLTTRTSEKCVGCYPRIEGRDPLSDGVPMEARCMATCVGKIRLQGLVRIAPDGTWVEDRANPLYFLVHVEKVALPLYPQLGTEPNGYYIPPRWVPRPYLEQMFGPGVGEAIERYRRPSRELLAVLQLFRTTQRMLFRYEIVEGPKVLETTVGGRPWTMYADTVVGFDEKGREAVRVPVVEPFRERPARYPNSI